MVLGIPYITNYDVEILKWLRPKRSKRVIRATLPVHRNELPEVYSGRDNDDEGTVGWKAIGWIVLNTGLTWWLFRDSGENFGSLSRFLVSHFPIFSNYFHFRK